MSEQEKQTGEDLLQKVHDAQRAAEQSADSDEDVLGAIEEDLGLEDFEEEPIEDETPVSIYEKFEMDQEMEKQGIVLNLGAAGEFKIARAGASNVEYTRAVAAQGKKAGVQKVKGGKISEAEATKRMAFIYGTTVVKDWDRVYGRDLKPIPYSKQAAVKLLLELPELLTVVMAEAHKADNYRKAHIEGAAGNS